MVTAAVPTLAEAAQDRARLVGLSFDALWRLLLEAGRLQTEIAAAMVPAQARAVTGTGITEDRALTIDEAAARLQIAPATMKRWLRKPPYDAAVVVRSRTCVRVSAQLLEQVLHGGSGIRSRRSGRGAGSQKTAGAPAQAALHPMSARPGGGTP